MTGLTPKERFSLTKESFSYVDLEKLNKIDQEVIQAGINILDEHIKNEDFELNEDEVEFIEICVRIEEKHRDD